MTPTTPAILDALSEGVVLLYDGHIQYKNRIADELLLDAAATDLVKLFGDDIAKQITTHLDTSPSEPYEFRAPSPCVAGDVLLLRILPFDDGHLISIQDYTRLHHLEQMKTDFVGNVSHELRTPLTVILGYLENFTHTPDIPPVWQRGMKLMQEQAVRMNELINDLLMLSRLESDESKPELMVDMPRLLMQVFDNAQASNQSGHVIDVHLDTAKNIIGIESYLYSAILNLVTNAIKYTPAGGEIDIIWEEVGDTAHLSVIDDGIGISHEHLSRLTERFYRVDSGRSRATGGTGLGLAIVKHVLNKHDARLEIESKEGAGSTFRIIFPSTKLIDGKSTRLSATTDTVLPTPSLG